METLFKIRITDEHFKVSNMAGGVLREPLFETTTTADLVLGKDNREIFPLISKMFEFMGRPEGDHNQGFFMGMIGAFKRGQEIEITVNSPDQTITRNAKIMIEELI